MDLRVQSLSLFKASFGLGSCLKITSPIVGVWQCLTPTESVVMLGMSFKRNALTAIWGGQDRERDRPTQLSPRGDANYPAFAPVLVD
jgi:hypothetical protein